MTANESAPRSFYGRAASQGCFPAEGRFFECCCGEAGPRCWRGGRHFLRCCRGRLGRCRGRRRPQLHAVSFGPSAESWATVVLGHSVLRWLGTPLLLFGSGRAPQGGGGEELPYTLPEGVPLSGYLIRKVLLTREVLEELPAEDLVLYLDAADTLVQRGGAAELQAAWSALVARAAGAGAQWSAGWEPVVFAGQGHCYPFEQWARANLDDGGEPAVERAPRFERAWGRASRAGPLLAGAAEVCAEVRGPGTLPFADTGTWLGRVRSARRLFGVMAAVAVAEKASDCMQVLKLVQTWFPGLAVVDTEAELFWTTETELAAREGYGVSEQHPRVQRTKAKTARLLCSSGSPTLEGYWGDGCSPPMLLGTKSVPFVLHHAGPSKATLGRRCTAAYAMEFVAKSDAWEVHDLDAGTSVRLHLGSAGPLAQGLQQYRGNWTGGQRCGGLDGRH